MDLLKFARNRLNQFYNPKLYSVSSNLWVSNIKPGIFHIGGKHNYYDHSASSTSVQNGITFAIEYGSGPVPGEYSADAMSIAGVDIEGYTFAEANDVSGLGPACGVGHFDGICDMGWDDISVDGVHTSLSEPWLSLENWTSQCTYSSLVLEVLQLCHGPGSRSPSCSNSRSSIARMKSTTKEGLDMFTTRRRNSRS